MRGPDFEIPPLDPLPRPEDPPTSDGPERRLGRPVRAAAVVALLGLVASAAFALYSAVGPSSTLPPVVGSSPSTARTLPSPPSTARVPPTTRPARTVFRTCLDSAENPGAARESPPQTPAWITFRFGPRVSTEALVMIADAAVAAHDTLGDAGALVVEVQCDIDEFAAATDKTPDELRQNIADGLVAYIKGDRIWIYGPTFDRRSSGDRRRAIHHEYFHGIQLQLSRTRSARSDVSLPLWLGEGSAEFFENAVTPGDLEAFRRGQVRRWDALGALASLEDAGGARVIGGSGAAYVVGSVASDYLITRYGRDLLQRDFWVAFGRTDWRSAFQQVFGITVDDFYAEFEAYRSTLPR